MENNQNQHPNGPNRKQMAPRDMIILALAVLVLTRIDWGNMNSFHVLILFLLLLALMLRWGNMRKEAVRKQTMERYKEQTEAKAAAAQTEGEATNVPDTETSVAETAETSSTETSVAETAEISSAEEKSEV